MFCWKHSGFLIQWTVYLTQLVSISNVRMLVPSVVGLKDDDDTFCTMYTMLEWVFNYLMADAIWKCTGYFQTQSAADLHVSPMEVSLQVRIRLFNCLGCSEWLQFFHDYQYCIPGQSSHKMLMIVISIFWRHPVSGNPFWLILLSRK